MWDSGQKEAGRWPKYKQAVKGLVVLNESPNLSPIKNLWDDLNVDAHQHSPPILPKMGENSHRDTYKTIKICNSCKRTIHSEGVNTYQLTIQLPDFGELKALPWGRGAVLLRQSVSRILALLDLVAVCVLGCFFFALARFPVSGGDSDTGRFLSFNSSQFSDPALGGHLSIFSGIKTYFKCNV